jgi:hypothetical protein
MKPADKAKGAGGGQLNSKGDSESIDDLENKLRVCYQNFLDYSMRCQVELKTQNQVPQKNCKNI